MDCSLYKVKVVQMHSREKRSDHQHGAPLTTHLPWCAHANSPAPLALVSKALGGANLLRCEGDLDRCQVQADKR